MKKVTLGFLCCLPASIVPLLDNQETGGSNAYLAPENQNGRAKLEAL